MKGFRSSNAFRIVRTLGLTAALLALGISGTEATDNVYLSIAVGHARAIAQAQARAAAQARARATASKSAQDAARVLAGNLREAVEMQAPVQARDVRPNQVPDFDPGHDRDIGDEHHPHHRRHAYGNRESAL